MERLVISLCAKGIIELSTSAISIITNKVSRAALEWQNRPLDLIYLIVWMDGIVFKVRDKGKIINKTVYLCVGLKQNGKKEVLGMWVGKSGEFFLLPSGWGPDRFKGPWRAGHTHSPYG